MDNCELSERLDNFFSDEESEILDYKEKYHENLAELLHDILCLANSDGKENKKLIFGIGQKILMVLLYLEI